MSSKATFKNRSSHAVSRDYHLSNLSEDQVNDNYDSSNGGLGKGTQRNPPNANRQSRRTSVLSKSTSFDIQGIDAIDTTAGLRTSDSSHTVLESLNLSDLDLSEDLVHDMYDSSSTGIGRGSRPNPPYVKRTPRHSSILSKSTNCALSSIQGIDEVDTSSHSLLESLGDNPSSHGLHTVAAVRAEECIEELFRSAENGLLPDLDRAKWEGIPRYAKRDLFVGRHLGKGSFSDAFEVVATVTREETPTRESLDRDRQELGKRMEARFTRGASTAGGAEGCRKEGDLHEERDSILGSFREGNFDNDDLDKQIDAMFLNKEEFQQPTQYEEDGLGGSAEDVFVPASKGPPVDTPNACQSQRRTSRRMSDASQFRETVCLGTHSRSAAGRQRRKVTLAMKCLSPQIRSSNEQFMIGVEDLVKETVMLASLDHPHIVTLHGRASGCVANSRRLSDGYFILIDKLKDTLDNRIHHWNRWKKFSDKSWPSSLGQMKVACSIADALAYLHSKRIAFRDLKPANVGFDTTGVLKLFDFGFAIHCPSSEKTDTSSRLLYDKCGTPRYMAPEVALEKPYHGLPADVYSFGILLWEICSLKKPYEEVKSAEEFHETVFEKNARPELAKHWPHVMTDVISLCWLTCPMERPAMDRVKTMLVAYGCELLSERNDGRDHKSSKYRLRLVP